MDVNPLRNIPVLLSVVLLGTGCAGTQKQPAEKQMSGTEKQEAKASSEFDLPPHHFIETGMSTDRLTSLVGPPEQKVQNTGHPDVWHYEFGLVLVRGGQVQYKYPPARSGTDKQRGLLENDS